MSTEVFLLGLKPIKTAMNQGLCLWVSSKSWLCVHEHPTLQVTVLFLSLIYAENDEEGAVWHPISYF